MHPSLPHIPKCHSYADSQRLDADSQRLDADSQRLDASREAQASPLISLVSPLVCNLPVSPAGVASDLLGLGQLLSFPLVAHCGVTELGKGVAGLLCKGKVIDTPYIPMRLPLSPSVLLL